MLLIDRSASHSPSPATVIVAAVLALGAVAALTYVALVAPRGVPALDYYVLEAEFDDVAQIADLSEVRIAGRHVGQVSGTRLRDGRATVTLQLYPGEGPLRSDSTARIRLKGSLGAKFVEVVPGRRGDPLASGATLPARQTSTAVELLDVLQALDQPRRRGLQLAVRGLGEGFLGRGADINDMLQVAPGFYGGVASLSRSVLARDGAAARFAPAAESLARAYDPVRHELAAGFEPQARVLGAFADRRQDIAELLDAAPHSLAAMREGFDAATPLLGETTRLARATTRLTRPAPAAFRETTVFLREARPAMTAARPLLRRLRGAVRPTVRFLEDVDPVLEPAARSLTHQLPVLRRLGPHGCDLLGFARNWRSALSYGIEPGTGDPLGELDNGQTGVGPITSLRVRPVRLTELESLSGDAPPTFDPTIGRNAYPDPCEAMTERRP